MRFAWQNNFTEIFGMTKSEELTMARRLFSLFIRIQNFYKSEKRTKQMNNRWILNTISSMCI